MSRRCGAGAGTGAAPPKAAARSYVLLRADARQPCGTAEKLAVFCCGRMTGAARPNSAPGKEGAGANIKAARKAVLAARDEAIAAEVGGEMARL